MAGIEAPEYQVNVSQENSINKFTVQGEENSRVLTLHLVENVSTENALQQTEIQQKPLDLTDCTVRLYVKKPDGNATFCTGEITATGADGKANTVLFMLTQQTLAAAGNAHCTVAIFGSNGTVLKATGITLDIAADDMEQTIVSTSEFVSLAEALNKAESAEKIAEDSAAEVNQTVSAASTELQSLETQSSDIATAETARVDAEGKRVTAESSRADAEGKRITAETARGEAEAQRTSNESTRQATEAARAAAESSRADVEGKRATAETARADAEQARQTAESGRATAEAARVDAESARVTAEQARQAAESSRQTAETARESGYNSMQTALAGKANVTHVTETVSSESGVHGLRWFDKKLQAKSGGNWDDISAVPRAFATYGVIWHYTQSSPTLERTDDSAAFTATATNGATAGHSDFDDKPIYKDIKICNVVNREVVAYEGEAGFKRDGSSGDVMLEIPKFYYKVTDDGTNRYLQLSDVSLDGFSIAPRHAPCDDYPNGLDKIYVGAYEASSEYKSISGQAPLVNLTRAQFRAGFAGRGAGYCQADWATQFEIQILYLVEFATWDSQLVVGNGNVGASAAISTGGSDSVTGLTGSSNIGSTSVAIKWRGLENLWGNVNEWRDGINFNEELIYVCTNPSKYADDTSTNYTKLAYSKIQTNGYISGLGLDSNTPWVQLPTAVAGSDSTYLCDKYTRFKDWRVACVGGKWNSGSDAGLLQISTGSSSFDFYPDVGSRLLVLPDES